MQQLLLGLEVQADDVLQPRPALVPASQVGRVQARMLVSMLHGEHGYMAPLGRDTGTEHGNSTRVAPVGRGATPVQPRSLHVPAARPCSHQSNVMGSRA